MSFILTAQHANPLLLARTAGFVAIFACLGAGQGFAQSKAPDASPPSVPVYLMDFELFSAPLTAKTKTVSPVVVEKPKSPTPLVYQDADQPSAQARRLIDFFAMTLLQALTRKGFNATRAAGQAPASGAQIRGVFAEPDAMNRIRRALLGSGAPNARFLLYVGIFNLGKQEQPLYLPAPVQQTSNEYGPVITLNTYVPLAKYEVDKNPTEEDVQKICNQIATSLTALLANNPNAFSH
jgi:hypothetical protein